MAVKTKKLYALCVGINDYQYVGKLGGCVPDATNMLNYLEKTTKDSEYELDAVLLTDAQATKDNICDKFLTHLTKAGSEDTALFYFSGHGAEEKADEIWKESDGRGLLTTVVCYDSRNGTVPDLADKEIRYMISKVAKKNPHFVLIMDSCHSGGTTRNTDIPDGLTPRLTGHSKGRTWDKFVFAKEFPYDEVKDKNIRDWMPQGAHLQFGSCNANELAYEVRGSGVFTSTLLDILDRCSGKIDYYSLLSRIKNYVKGRYPQTPQFYAVGEDKTKAQAKYFLGGASAGNGKPFTANVLYNRKMRQWILDLGALHGAVATSIDSDVLVDILDYDDKVIGTAKIKSTLPGISYLDVTGINLDFKESYGGILKGVFLVPTNIHIKGEKEGVEAMKAYLSGEAQELDDFGEAVKKHRLELLKKSGIEFVDDESKADFCIYVKDNIYHITNPFKTDPIVQQFPIGGIKAYKREGESKFENVRKSAIAATIISLSAVSKYQFIKSLANPKSKLIPRPPVVFKIVDADTGNELKITDDELDLTGVQNIQVSITNKHPKPLYVSLLYMSQLFGINNDMLERVILMEPNQTDYIWEGDPIPVDVSEWIEELNVSTEYFYLKLIMSTAEFGEEPFLQAELQPPNSENSTRGLRRRSSTPKTDDWTTSLLRVHYKNPMYEK